MKSSSAFLNAADTLLAFNRDTYKNNETQKMKNVKLPVNEDLSRNITKLGWWKKSKVVFSKV